MPIKAFKPKFEENQILFLKDPLSIPFGEQPLSPVVEIPSGTLVKAEGKHYLSGGHLVLPAEVYYRVAIEIARVTFHVWVEERLLSTEQETP